MKAFGRFGVIATTAGVIIVAVAFANLSKVRRSCFHSSGPGGRQLLARQP